MIRLVKPTCLLACAVLLGACGASSTTRAQAEAQRSGLSYLEATAREAALAAGVDYLGCDHSAARTAGSGERYTVEGCGGRVVVRCSWSAGGGPTCSTEPEIEAAQHARDAAAVAVASVAPAPVAAPVAAATRPSAPQPSARAAAFRVVDGVREFVAVDGWMEMRARNSDDHAGSVLVIVALRSEAADACGHTLDMTAAGEPVHFEPDRRDGAVTYFVLDAPTFASFGERVPLRATVCGQTITFGHTELRALRSFIAALSH